MPRSDTEPFPRLSASPQALRTGFSNGITTRRRKSSGLGGELPGDSDVPGFATALSTPPATPTIEKYRSSGKGARRSKRRTIRRTLSRFKRTCIRHTWVLPLVLLSTIVSLYLVYPYPSNPIASCLFLSYPLPRDAASDAPTQYGKGARDFAFVGFYIIVLSFTREFIMQRVIRPIAIRYGIRSKAKQARFMEQFYTALYFSVFGPFGLWVMSRTPVWYFNTAGMYEGFPHRTHEAVFKAYYLLQAAYWAQQMIVLLLMLEAPRKDFKELVAHHFITVALIWSSYRFHFTYMGIAVYITMDISDFFLASSKCLNYIDHPLVGPYFAFFMLVWGYMRHYINLRILYSILTEFATIGPFELNWVTQQYKCWISQIISFSLLAALQAVNLFWWFYICRIAWRFAVSKEARDERSEYEETEGEELGEVEGEDGAMGAATKVVESVEQSVEKMMNGAGMNGKTNGVVNGTSGTPTPQLLVNGEVPQSPLLSSSQTDDASLSSRLRPRKAGKR